MLQLFRTNQIAFNLLLIVYILIIRGAAYFVPYPEPKVEGQGILSDWLLQHWGVQSYWAITLSIFLVFLQALMINIIVAKFRMATTISLLPGLFYGLMMSLFPDFLLLTPTLLANTFLILAIWELYESYRKNDASGHIVNVGFWIGVASLFYLPSVYFLLMAIFGLGVLRAIRLREILMLLIGYGIPFLWTGVYYFWIGQLDYFMDSYVYHQLGLFKVSSLFSSGNWIKVLILGVFILLVMLSYGGYISKRNIQAQKNVTVLYWTVLISLLGLLVQHDAPFHHLLLFIIPVGTLLSFNFVNLPVRVAEALHLLIFAGVLIWQFHPYWLG